MRVWGMLKNEDIIKQDTTVSAETFEAALMQICECFDLTKPIMLRKHQTEVKNFRRTIFYPDDFIEPVSFDTLELEIITKKKKTPR
jgi:hypothetical protein